MTVTLIGKWGCRDRGISVSGHGHEMFFLSARLGVLLKGFAVGWVLGRLVLGTGTGASGGSPDCDCDRDRDRDRDYSVIPYILSIDESTYA